MERARKQLLFALLLAVFLVYVILASNFESFRGPFVILLSIPLALVGVVAGLRAAGLPLSVLAFIGIIMLAGIVVNNAIVLVDYVQQLAARGIPRRDAIVKACRIRLRPVIMTAMTTVLALVPMAIASGEGAELRVPLAVTVIGGLTSATLLTLVVVPILYDVLRVGPGASSAVGSAPVQSDGAEASIDPVE
jgi:HAE1 family hydrophobic/amphiphilic exporter-1